MPERGRNGYRILIAILLLLLTGSCGSPGSASLDTPDPTLDTCRVDSDCVLALRIDICCSCPEVTTLARVKATRGVEVYVPGRDYGSLRPEKCSLVDCPPCPSPPAGVTCKSEICCPSTTIQENK